MSFPNVYREVEEMVPRVALHTRTARAIARKAGLRQGEAGALEENQPRTLIDAYVDSDFGTEYYQWDADLTGFTRIRLVTRSTVEVVLWYSVDGFGSQDIDPGDYTVFPSAPPYDRYYLGYIANFVGGSEISVVSGSHNGLGWSGIPPSLRGPLRLSIAPSLFTWPLGGGWGAVEDDVQGFFLGMEAR